MATSWIRRVAATAAAGVLVALASWALAGDDACLACHADAAKAKGTLIDGAVFARSVHGGREGCARCHFGYDTYPHPKEKETAGCADCHADQNDKFATGVHGKPPSPDSKISRAPACADCHGVHDVFRAKDRESKLFPLNVPRTCGACHFGHDGVAQEPVEALMKERYTDDTHGSGLLLSGLVVAPTCVSCHGGHEILAPQNAASTVNRAHVAETCGKCHLGVLEQYRASVHGRTPRGQPERNSNGKEPPTCIDCHQPHQIRKPDETFKLGVLDACTQCHGDRGATYRGTFHGRMTELGSARVAKCADCHTAHRILPADDPLSSVSPAHRVATCAKCHPGATEAFASYEVHANPRDAAKWPTLHWIEWALTAMLHGTWMFGAVHMLLWLQRGLRDRTVFRRDTAAELAGRWYERWRPAYRYLHLILMIAFTTLALTGLPVLFHDHPLAQTIYAAFGGPGVMRVLHRIGGALTVGYFAAYFIHLGRRMASGEKGLFRGGNSMVPRWKDAQDLTAHLKWFVRGGTQPQFDRWAYWHKFYFWAELWGVGVMAASGIVMWFPVAVTHVLPGSVVNVAHMVHSHEAILATSVIFVLHSFHMNLRPGKFPMDPVVFTGRISEEALRTEHPLEYERMRAEGRLESEALPAPSAEALRRAHRIGGFMLGMAFLLLAFMVATLF